jgi:HEAT repeat protein
LLLALFARALAGVPEDLEAAANDDLPMSVRQEAFGRLCKEGSTREVVRLARLEGTPAPQKWVAVRSLGPNPSPEARDALVELLGAKDAPVRMAVMAAMGVKGDKALGGRVAAKLDDPAILVRAAAADALAQLKDAGTLADLDRALGDPSNIYRGQSLWVRRHFVDAITAIGTDEAPRLLVKRIDDDDPLVVEAALHGLETVAGFSYGSGRTAQEEKEAWRRWAKGR